MLQFHLQGEGVQIPSQFLSMLPYVATIVVLVLISRNATWIRANMPASLGKPFFPGALSRLSIIPAGRSRHRFHPQEREPMTLVTKRSLLKLAGWPPWRPPPPWSAAARRRKRRRRRHRRPAAAASAPAKPEPLKIAFAYVGPVGDGGWTFAHDNGRKAVEKEFGDKVVTSFVEKVPEAADAERVFRDMVGQGNKLIFGTTFGYMEPMLKVAADTQGREVRARHRLQAGREHAHLRQPHLRGRLHGRRHRRQA